MMSLLVSPLQLVHQGVVADEHLVVVACVGGVLGAVADDDDESVAHGLDAKTEAEVGQTTHLLGVGLQLDDHQHHFGHFFERKKHEIEVDGDVGFRVQNALIKQRPDEALEVDRVLPDRQLHVARLFFLGVVAQLAALTETVGARAALDVLVEDGQERQLVRFVALG